MKVGYRAGDIHRPAAMFMKAKASRVPTEAVIADAFGIIVWTNQTKSAIGGGAAWGDVLRMAVHAATHNPAARADLEAALAAIPAETKEEG